MSFQTQRESTKNKYKMQNPIIKRGRARSKKIAQVKGKKTYIKYQKEKEDEEKKENRKHIFYRMENDQLYRYQFFHFTNQGRYGLFICSDKKCTGSIKYNFKKNLFRPKKQHSLKYEDHRYVVKQNRTYIKVKSYLEKTGKTEFQNNE